MHLNLHDLARELPILWDRLSVHDRIGIVLDQYHFEYGPEAVDGILVCEVAEILRSMGADVRLVEWCGQVHGEDPNEKRRLHALCVDGVDWDAEGAIGEGSIQDRWRTAYYPKIFHERVYFTRVKDATDELKGETQWLSELIGPGLREQVVQLEADRINASTTPVDRPGPLPRL